MKKIKIIFVILLVLSFFIIFSKEKSTSTSSIQIVLKLPKLDKNISTISTPDFSSIPYSPPKKTPQNIEVVDIKIDKGINLKIKNKSDYKNLIKVSVSIIDRVKKNSFSKNYLITLSEQKTYSIKLKNEMFYDLKSKTIFTVISNEKGESLSYGFSQ